MEVQLSLRLLLWALFLAWLASKALRLLYNVLFHPLRAFPGPAAAKATTWWKTYIEVVKQESMTDVLFRLHEQFGDIVRVGPNELHFADPSAYHDIYSPTARWDKEKTLYEAFGEDHSSFGLRTYAEAKQRKDVLQPMFSRRAILGMQGLVRQNIDHLAAVLAENDSKGKPSDLLFAFRCFAMDTITTFCFAKSVHAMDSPDFAAPIVEAMDNSLPTFHLFKHFPLFRKTIFALPPWLAIKASPETAGLTHLQVILGKQVADVLANPESLQDAPHPIIYHRLLDADAHKGHRVPDATALYEEAQTMMFAGGVTVGDALMIGHFHILDQPTLHQRLRAEVLAAWPVLAAPPRFEVLEALPLLTATIKEALRTSPGGCSPLLRVVPARGATISGASVPGGTIVGMSGVFVHQSRVVFGDDAAEFRPDRWLEVGGGGGGGGSDGDKDARSLDRWLVAFSKGPRSCLGMNLAWVELYFAFATMLRRFEMTPEEGTRREDLVWRDCFTPYFYGKHLRVWCKPVAA